MTDDRDLLKAADKIARAADAATQEQLDVCLMQGKNEGDERVTQLAKDFKITAEDLMVLVTCDLLPQEARCRGGKTLRIIGPACALYVARLAADRADRVYRKINP